MNHGYYGAFNKYTTLVFGYRKFATDKALALQAQGLSVAAAFSEFRLGSYICRIHLLAVLYTLHIHMCVCVILILLIVFCVGRSKGATVI